MRPVYDNTDFSRRFGTPRRVFDRFYSVLSVRPDIRKVDAVGKSAIRPLQRLTGALRVLSYGHSYDEVDEVVEASETSMAKTVKVFCAVVLDVFWR